MLREALEVIEAWGFTYKTVAFNWVKQNKTGAGLFWGLGNWTRSNSEICLLAVKGKPKRMSASVGSCAAKTSTSRRAATASSASPGRAISS